MLGKGPFRLGEKRTGRVSAAKADATCLIMLSPTQVVIGTAAGQVILSSSATQTQVAVLKPKRAVTRMVKVFNFLLALCGGELFVLELATMAKQTLSVFQPLKDLVVVDLCVNQRGPPDWGLCIVTSDRTLHLFANFTPNSFEKLREIPVAESLVGSVLQCCWYETVSFVSFLMVFLI
jgi:hypothetical protein